MCRPSATSAAQATALWWLGRVDITAGDNLSARQRLGEALRSFQSFDMNAETLGCLEDHARLVRSLGFAEDAVRLYAAAAAVREKLVLPRPPRSDRRWRDDVEAVRHALGPAFDAAWAEGQRWEIKEAVRHALAPASAVAV